MKRLIILLLLPIAFLIYGFQAGIRPISVYDALYLKLNGSNANTNVDIGSNDFYGRYLYGDSATLGQAGANYTLFDTDGHQTMVGDARPWRDQLSDAITLQRNGTGVSLNVTDGTVEFATNAVYHATFTLADAMYCNIQLNHDKDLTASIYPHIHFFQTENHVPNFVLEYRWQKNLGEKTTAWTPLKCNTLADTYSGTTKNNIALSVAIAVPSGTAISDIVQFRIYRDTTNVTGLFGVGVAGNDTYTTAVGVTAFDVHFMVNSIGSNDEYSK